MFKLVTDKIPAGDQPSAITSLYSGLTKNYQHQTLLGVTGSGKTFTIANVIEKIQKPTLVIAHNKTLAAQLAQEYRDFFPHNAVHYFVSYYDYYQPEAYMPASDTYIEKEAMINEEIDRLRHASTQALLTRSDVIIVASVSCIYGLGSPAEYEKVHKKFRCGDEIDRRSILRTLVGLYFERTTADLNPGQFRAVGNTVEIMPINERTLYRITFTDTTISSIAQINPLTRVIESNIESFFLFPAKHFVTPKDERIRALQDMKIELTNRLKVLESEGKLLEVQRLKRRTEHDMALIREVGYCNGIENYSRHFDGRNEGEPPFTLLSYFPHKADGTADFLTVIDESHVTVPQLGGMYAGDRSRKLTLIDHGFRLPSAADNRPLTFQEFSKEIGQCIYTSATPGTYEIEHSKLNNAIAQQIIRPTGLVDPKTEIRPVTENGNYKGQIRDFITEAERTIKAGGRVLVTTLTKQMAEDLSEFLKEKEINSKYLHSDIKTIERIETIRDFRKGIFDCIVGVNLLREGLDLPEVQFVAILDADKQGFLRSETALIQTIGRAARNIDGRVILYADVITKAIENTIRETDRRREIQLAYNKKHNITPQSITKHIHDITEHLSSDRAKELHDRLVLELSVFNGDAKKLVHEKTTQMEEAVAELDFETAALLRDEILELKGEKATKRRSKRR